MKHAVATILVLVGPWVLASPFVAPGDTALRHDIQRLADFGIITGPVSTWPLEWGPILSDIDAHAAGSGLPADIVDALARIRVRANWETRADGPVFRAELAISERTSRLRSFNNAPREEGELSAGVAWTGDWLSVNLNAGVVSDPVDGDEFRADGSQISAALGNISIGVSTLDRWWGPAWDSSLILSNNARSIPALTVDRRHAEPFESRWLSWIGPWDFSVITGRLERDRTIPHTNFIGARFAARPWPSLEVAISRSAQWCGDGRPCNLDTFWNLLAGRDNSGDGDLTPETEPGNQTAALDFRLHLSRFGMPIALYGQFMAEDEAGGFPSRYLAQLGVDGSAYLFDRWSTRWFAEAAVTSCDAIKSTKIFNCAYNHSIYSTGYRYRGRSIGHAADNDARLVSIGLILVDAEDRQWHAMLRHGELNRGGAPDSRHSLTATEQDITSLDFFHSRALPFGVIDIGLGYERIDDLASTRKTGEARAYLRWRSSY